MQHAEQPDEKLKRWNHVLFPCKYLKWGGSWAIIIPAPVREILRLRPGDTLLMRLHVPFFTVRRGEPDHVIDLKNFSLEDYPPRWPTVGTKKEDLVGGKHEEGIYVDPEGGEHARAESAPERSASGATEPDAGDDGPGSTK